MKHLLALLLVIGLCDFASASPRCDVNDAGIWSFEVFYGPKTDRDLLRTILSDGTQNTKEIDLADLSFAGISIETKVPGRPILKKDLSTGYFYIQLTEDGYVREIATDCK